MDPRINCLTHVVECTCRAIIDSDHPLSVEAAGGQEHLVCEVDCQPGDEGLSIGAPGRPWTDPHGHTRVAAVLAGEQPLPAAGTIVLRAADASAMAGEGVGHA
jgi:hypothetical protein